MKNLYRISGFLTYFLIVFLNAFVDLGHKIVLQNTVFKTYDGTELMVLTAIINALILLPFVFLFSPSGFISDKYCKTKIVRVSSFIAIIITSLITLSYYLGYFEMAFVATLLLAAQSAFYSPAKYGLIKEMFGTGNVVKANSITQAITIIAILLGAVIYSIFFESLLIGDVNNKDEILKMVAPIGFVLIISSVFEFLLSLKLPITNAKKITDNFAIKKYLTGGYFKCNNSIIKSNRVIWHSIIGLSIFWAISQIVVAVFGAFLKSSAGVENTVIAQSLLAVGGLGIVVGSMIANKVSKNYIELGIVPLGSLGVAITLFIIPTLQNVNIIAVVFFIYGLCAGLVLVPLNALIQLSAPGSSLGRILAANNFYQNIFMLIALIATAYLSYLQFDSGDILLLAAIIATIGALWTFIKLPQSLIIYIVRFAFKLRYKINAIGVENVPTNKGTLLLGNHVSYIDWAILQIVYPQQIRFVMEKSIYKKWYLKWFLDFFKIIPISSSGSKNSLKEVAKALNDGHTVALFPEGMLTKNGGMNTFLAGYEHILKEVKDCVIVPFYLHGLWESKFSNAADKIKQSGHNIYVKFGAELPTSIKAVQLKNIVIDLSVDVWHNYINQQKDIASMWIEQIKKKNNFYVADSNSILHRNKFLAATLLMRKWLKNKLGNNNNIAVILPSTVAGAICNMSLFCLARTVVNLNYTTGIRPLKLAIKKAEIQTIITSKKFIKKLQDKGFDLSEVLNNGNIIYLEDMQKFAHKLRAIGYFLRATFYPVWLLKLLFITKVKITKTAVILFSSGSEGDPKGIMLSHKNLIANVKQVKTMLNPSLNDKIMGTLPNFHSFGLTVCTLIPQLEGIPVIYHPDPTDGYGIGKLVAEHKATILLGTATFFRLYLRNRKLQPLMLASIRLVVAGAEKLPNKILDDFKQKFGLDIYEGYGTTETAPVASSNIPNALLPKYWKIQQGQKTGTIGKPLVGTSIIITDPSSFEVLKQGDAGMILISGPQVMQGYLNDPIQTNEVIKIINNNRYYITGDKGKIDKDGFVTIVDRYSRFAKIGGEMISLGSCEAQISACLGDEIEIATTNLTDVKKGEKIVLLFTGDMTEEDLKRKLIATQINPLYLPSSYHKVEVLPKLGAGKADFKGVKKLAQHLEAGE